MTTNFALKPRRDDPQAAMRVQSNLEQLRDVVDSFTGRFKEGSSTITSGNFNVVITHGLGSTNYKAQVTPTVDPGGRWWVSAKTATQFTINIITVAPVGGVSFDWVLKGA